MTIKEFEVQNALGLLSDALKRQLARDPTTSKEMLTRLSIDKHWSVRYWVAKNSNTPEKVLKKLSTDRHKYVRIVNE
ncbi:hypothetical protein LCGC14_2277740 [marine sediment metagenome]|uniref:Uncharacterized protein n=1 Tax=marine sediment metagenome TaxID=412755 RepID=A0A0F9CV84_9ZZZZ